MDKHVIEKTLQGAIDNGMVRELPPGTYEIDEPIHVTINATQTGPMGVWSPGARLISKLADDQDVITIDIVQPGVDARYLTLSGLSIFGSGIDGNGLVMRCATNDSWLYNFVLRDINVEHCGKSGIVLAGSLFEASLFNCWAHGNSENGIKMMHDGAGVVSAMSVFGGGARKNGGNGISLEGGARDVKVIGAYFCENGSVGIWAEQGITLVQGCGFENNKDFGVAFQNYATLKDCTASTWGPQMALVKGYLAGQLIIESSGCEGYGDATGQMYLAQADGNGDLILASSGRAEDCRVSDGVNIKMTPPNWERSAERKILSTMPRRPG